MRTLPAAILIAAAAALLTGCGGTEPAPTLPAEFDGPVIAADAIAFDVERLDVPAGVAFELGFLNLEAAPHNVSIYTDETTSQALFEGEVFGGPAAQVYEVPALAAGEYFFQCDVHPPMRGRVVASGG